MCPVLPTTSPGMPKPTPPTSAVTQAGTILNPASEVSTTLSASRLIVFVIRKWNLKQTASNMYSIYAEQGHLYTTLHPEVNLFCWLQRWVFEVSIPFFFNEYKDLVDFCVVVEICISREKLYYTVFNLRTNVSVSISILNKYIFYLLFWIYKH